MSIRVSVQLHPQHTPMADLTRAAVQADELGFDALFTWDHFYPLYGMPDSPIPHPVSDEIRASAEYGGHFEGWSLLAAWAALTKRIEIGMLVSCNSYRNPELLADIARTVDHISNGRVILGVGSGWFEKDYVEYGYPFGTAGSRLKDLDVALPRMKARLAKLHPQPVRNPMPIMIGGGGEKLTLRMTAQHAHLWNYFGTPAEMAHKMAVLDKWCAEVGRNPAEIERSILIMSPEALAQLDDYYAVGIRHFICGMGHPFSFDHAKRLLEWRASRTSAAAAH